MNKKILRLAIPNILSNLSVPILSSVDTAIVGHFSEVYYLGAIAIGSMIFNFIYWGFGFLRMGTTGLSAQHYGEKKDDKNILVLARAFSLAVVSALILITLQYFISDISFKLVHGSVEVEKYAREYFHIRIYAAPATLALYAFTGWFLGNQNAKYPLILAVVVNVLNIIFNLIFIYQFGMKSDGVALGTVVAQYLGLALAVFLFLKKYKSFLPKLNYKKVLDFEPIKQFFSVNFDIFIRTLCIIFAFTYFTAKSAELGEDILAVNTILLQLWMILSYGVDGFAYAAESLVGKYFGAKNKFKLEKVVSLSFIWGMGFGVLLTLVYLFLGKPIVGIYTDKIYLINLAMSYFAWTVIAPLANSICFIWDGVFIGATSTKAMRNSMILSLVIYFVLYFLTRDHIGNHSLWLAMIGFMLARGITLTIYAPKAIFNKLA